MKEIMKIYSDKEKKDRIFVRRKDNYHDANFKIKNYISYNLFLICSSDACYLDVVIYIYNRKRNSKETVPERQKTADKNIRNSGSGKLGE